MHANYFEGVLQIRNPNDEIFEFIATEIEKKGDVFITKKTKIKGGYDLYITNRRFIQALGRKLQQKFGGELKMSETLYSRDKMTSKDIFRISVFYKYCSAKVGDIKDYRGEKVKIVKMGSKKATVKDEKGKSIFVDYCNLK